MNKEMGKLLSGALLAVSIVAGAYVMACAVRDFKVADRYVTVKGLVERDVSADLALWTLKFRTSGDDLVETQKQAMASRDLVVAFLKDNGITDGDISTSLRVIDRKSQEYGENRADQARYIIEVPVQVRTTDVEKVTLANQKTTDLVSKGIALVEDNTCTPGPNYSFTQLNAIKPEMLAEATQNARKAAEQFAADSGSKVGSIRRANQGVFSVNERDRSGEGDSGGCFAATPNKKVRLVTTIDYFLAK